MPSNRFMHTDQTQFNPSLMRLGLILGMLMYGAFGYLDLLMMPSNYRLAWGIRFGIILPLLLLSYFLSYYKPIFNYSKIVLLALITFGQFGILAMIAASNATDPAFITYYAGLILVMLWTSSVFLLTFRATLHIVISTVLLYNIVAIFIQGMLLENSKELLPWYIGNNFFLISAGALVIVGSKQLELRLERIRSINSALEREKAALALATEQAQRSDQLKTTFLQNISHEIRTPLNGILGFSQLLQDRDEADFEERQLYFSQLDKSSRRLLKVVTDVLELSMIESGNLSIKIKPIDFDMFIEPIKAFYFEQARAAGLDFKYIPDETGKPVKIETDDIKLRLILQHLLDNALKFTKKGEIVLWHQMNEDALLLGVRDTGSGIRQEDLLFIFDLFWQAEAFQDSFFGGNGMGLPIVGGLSKALGIDLKLSSKEGEGTEFVLAIPVNTKNNSKV